MTTFDLETLDLEAPQEGTWSQSSMLAETRGLVSPFAVGALGEVEQAAEHAFGSTMRSPFSEGFTSDATDESDAEVMNLVAAELDDEDFVEALEMLASEAAARSMQSPAVWNVESEAFSSDTEELEQWMESIVAQADGMLVELGDQYAQRTVDSVSETELDEFLEALRPDYVTGPLDAQELFFGSLKKKLKKVAGAVKNVVKKGVSLASKILPLGIIFRRLRPIIRPLLRRVLDKAIGKLPRPLRRPARTLARRYGLREMEENSEIEDLAAEFDAEVAQLVLADEAAAMALEHELSHDQTGESGSLEQLDRARLRLADELLEAEPAEPPTKAMEQFVPAAILPIARMGIKVAGRQRVVNFIAGLLAKLIAPVVGRRLARPLSTQIADQGLRLLQLETTATDDRLGAEAAVAAIEDTLQEVLALPEAWLENELLTEMAVQEAFEFAVERHFPAEALRADEVQMEGERSHGLWVMMPRAASRKYRYKRLAVPARTLVTPRIARSVVFRNGETLEDRLEDEGLASWPVETDFELYELLPGGDVGHIAGDDGGSGPGAHAEFDVVEEDGQLELLGDMRQSRQRRGTNRRVVRVKARGRAVRKGSPFGVRFDVKGSQPELRLHITLSERRAAKLAEHLDAQRPRDAVKMLSRATGAPIRRAAAKRLVRVLSRHGLKIDASSASLMADRVFDAVVGAAGTQIRALAPTISSAAKDSASGLTVTATFSYPSKQAVLTGEPSVPTLIVRPGRHRD